MKINWKVRFNNPLFYVSIVLSIVTPILAYFGLSWEQMTTWQALGNLFIEAIKNPVVVVAVLVSLYNAVIDFTTSGVSDSQQALTYSVPKKDE